MGKIKSIKGVQVKDKKVLIRIDVNSPVVHGNVLDSPRFKESAETIKYLVKNQSKVIILAHQGRKGDDDFVSLVKHANILSSYLGRKIKYVDDLFGKKAENEINKLKKGEVIMLKNVRNYDDETDVKSKSNRYPSFLSLFDLYVNDAFSVSHRRQGSIILPPKYLPAYMGISMENELSALNKFQIKNKPIVYLLGGEKIEDYFSLLDKLKNRKSKLIASGVLGNLFLIAKGDNLGYENKWLKDKGYFKLLQKLKVIYKKHKSQIILPIDFAFDVNGRREFPVSKAPFKNKIWDVGHESIKLFKNNLKKTKAIFMKGPVGYSEVQEFSYGTVEILREVSLLSKNKKIFSLLGGGHLTTSIAKYGIVDNFSHISLSGGALIAYISGHKLPGIEALKFN